MYRSTDEVAHGRTVLTFVGEDGAWHSFYAEDVVEL